ncbi:unnamed protein product [Lactuca saligna]|uniref:Glucan endo-1,3-beta-D-glucosidase n=1 Tax=Lactuca saligna TaxID=75948 RepID=A0AA35YDM5_LACSI|nr:unnamed protein product [Lactuca saligna]
MKLGSGDDDMILEAEPSFRNARVKPQIVPYMWFKNFRNRKPYHGNLESCCEVWFSAGDAASVGICYGRLGDDLPSEQEVVDLYQSNDITRMRLYDPNPNTLQALQGTNIELLLDVPNSDLQSLTDPSAARTLAENNIQNYLDVKFRYITVGNKIDPNNGNSRFVNFVLEAMRNVHQAIVDAGLADQIKVSTATYTGLLSNTYPPSVGEFHDNVKSFIEPIIRFLRKNNLSMLANIYPYFACRDNPNISLPYSLFTSGPLVNDNGLVYSNLFDAMLDAYNAAQTRLGGGDLNIVVSESGWAPYGHRVATPENVATYYQKSVEHVKEDNGTLARPENSIETCLFAMFNENSNEGDEYERHFGLFFPDQGSKYELSF